MAAYLEIAAHSAYNIFSLFRCLIVNLVFSHFGFWSGNFFLIAPFPDHCLLVPFCAKIRKYYKFSNENFQFLQHLFITWAYFRNVNKGFDIAYYHACYM